MHATWIGAILAHIDFLDEQIERLSEAIGEQLRPFAPAVELLCSVPGIKRRCAEAIDLVLAKRDPAGRWALENVHQGPTHFDMDSHEGAPSRWNTLRASRVLDWAAV